MNEILELKIKKRNCLKNNIYFTSLQKQIGAGQTSESVSRSFAFSHVYVVSALIDYNTAQGTISIAEIEECDASTAADSAVIEFSDFCLLPRHNTASAAP